MARAASTSEILSWQKSGRPVPGATLPDLFSADQLDAFARSVTVGIRDMAEDAAVEALQQSVIQSRAEVMAAQTARSGGIAPLCTVVIDGVADAPLSAIKPTSFITLIWNYLPEIARRTYEALQQRSPRRSGKYIEGLLVYVDGEPAGFQAITVDTREVRLVASVPYARRLEVGKDARGRPWVKEVSPHIVEETAIYAKRKFSDLATITYSYVDLADAWQLTPRGMIARHFEGGRWRYGHTPRTTRGQLETHVQYPSILIRPLE